MALPSRLRAGLPEKAPRRSIILVCILSQRCPRLVPYNYSECDCVAGFGISETQTRSELPSRLSFQLPSLSLCLSLPLCLFGLKHFYHIQNGRVGQEVFRGLGSFQPFHKRGCANAAPWPWQQLSSRSVSNRRRRGRSTLTSLCCYKWRGEEKIKNKTVLRKNGKQASPGSCFGFRPESMKKWASRSCLYECQGKRGEKQSWADSVSRCYLVELLYTGIITQHSAVLSPDSEDNLDSRGKKFLSSWPQTLCFSAHAYNIFLQPWGCFSPLSSLRLLLLFPPLF